MRNFWYLATPYSNYPKGHEAAFKDACAQAGLLIKAGVGIFCPIAHAHSIAYGDNPPENTHEVWLAQDEAFMTVAKGLIVCTMDGWSSSKGIGMEIDFFDKADKPMLLMFPDQVPYEGLRHYGEKV